MSISTAEESTAEETKGGGKKKKLILILVGVLAVAGAAYWFLLKPSPADGKEPKPEAGDVMALEPISINLAGGHYLKLGLALQLTAEVAHEPEGSQALDHAIELFSGQSIKHIEDPKHRKELKAELAKELDHAYHGDVMAVYFTSYVTQ